MANDLDQNPLVYDTVVAAAATTVTEHLLITAIRLVDSANDWEDGDAWIVQDQFGKPVWEHRLTAPGAVADLQTSFSPPLAVHGLAVPTLASGKVYIYFLRP